MLLRSIQHMVHIYTRLPPHVVVSQKSNTLERVLDSHESFKVAFSETRSGSRLITGCEAAQVLSGERIFKESGGSQESQRELRRIISSHSRWSFGRQQMVQ